MKVCFWRIKFKLNVFTVLTCIIMVINGARLPFDTIKARKNCTKEVNTVLENINICTNFNQIENKEKNEVNEETNSNSNNELHSILNMPIYCWKIQIPKINLEARITEGTSEEVLNEYIGHFEETKRIEGNIGLAAHNRGYKVNYFQRLKELEIGDEIIYTYNNYQTKYIVSSKRIITETEWEVLENTENNVLTLITCLEDKPEYRRCIQAIEKI